jgi:hypothetical protein
MQSLKMGILKVRRSSVMRVLVHIQYSDQLNKIVKSIAENSLCLTLFLSRTQVIEPLVCFISNKSIEANKSLTFLNP